MPTRGSVAIVGAAESDLGLVPPNMTPVDLMVQGIVRALDDCGLKLGDVDGLFAAAAQVKLPTLALAEYLKIRPRYQDTTRIGGSSFLTHVAHAQLALEAGECNVAVITYGSTQRSVTRAVTAVKDNDFYETLYRPMLPPSAYAFSAARHMHEYGTTREDLAAVAVSARKWALLNPKAWEKEPLTIEQVLNARMVSYPFTVRDCCLVTDGGGAIVMTRADRARGLKKKPAYVLGVGEYLSHNSISQMENLTVSGAAYSGPQAYAMAKLGPKDVRACEVYDAFTINTLLFMEDLGFCRKGEGGPFISSGAIAPGGSMPVNTNGGGLSYGHPGMYGLFTLIEATRQIRGEGDKRQVSGADVVLAHGNGGVLSSQCTVILGSEAAL